MSLSSDELLTNFGLTFGLNSNSDSNSSIENISSFYPNSPATRDGYPGNCPAGSAAGQQLTRFTFMVHSAHQNQNQSQSHTGPELSPHGAKNYETDGQCVTCGGQQAGPQGATNGAVLTSCPRKDNHLCQREIMREKSVRELPHGRTTDGVLLTALEKDVLFPVVSMVHLRGPEHQQQHFEDQKNPQQMCRNVLFFQGFYKELKRVIPSDSWLFFGESPVSFGHNRTMSVYDDNHRVSSRSTSASVSSTCSSSCNGSGSSRPRSTPYWILIGYKSLEKTLNATLETTWKEWTGVRHLYLNLRSDFEIRKISFYHRAHPMDNLDLFMYIVTLEIGNVTDGNMMWLLDFVQRTRVDRMKGYMTLYTEVEPELSFVQDEYQKYKNHHHQQQKYTKNQSRVRVLPTISVPVVPSSPNPLPLPPHLNYPVLNNGYNSQVPHHSQSHQTLLTTKDRQIVEENFQIIKRNVRFQIEPEYLDESPKSPNSVKSVNLPKNDCITDDRNYKYIQKFIQDQDIHSQNQKFLKNPEKY